MVAAEVGTWLVVVAEVVVVSSMADVPAVVGPSVVVVLPAVVVAAEVGTWLVVVAEVVVVSSTVVVPAVVSPSVVVVLPAVVVAAEVGTWLVVVAEVVVVSSIGCCTCSGWPFCCGGTTSSSGCC